jgi:hypothetical protein
MSEYINNASEREEQLKDIIRQLHEGKSVAEVQEAFADLLEDVGPDEIVRIEEALVDEGLDPEMIQPLCDVHVAVFREALDAQQAPETIPGHPVFTYRAENLGVERALDRLETALDDLEAEPGPETFAEARAALDRLMEYDRHYLRKENILFAYLERTGFAGPSKVMWGVHNEIRDRWKALDALLGDSYDADAFDEEMAEEIEAIFEPMAKAIRDMVYKEENILFPAALQRLSEEEWAEIREQGDEIGYCYARPGTYWEPEAEAKEEAEKHIGTLEGVPEGLLPLTTGALSVEQIDWMLQALPIDITFVDENDEVRYFSETEERIFQRSPAIIGRKVQNCHPPQSVDRVQEIIDDFRDGTRDRAEFWIQMQGMFVHIRYFALRDDEDAYRGAIEVTQNLKPLRELEGEKRLLDE